MALTRSEKTSAAPKMVSSAFGKLEARRQRTAACACTAGATPAASTPAIPAFLMSDRRSMEALLCYGEKSETRKRSVTTKDACRSLTHILVRQALRYSGVFPCEIFSLFQTVRKVSGKRKADDAPGFSASD